MTVGYCDYTTADVFALTRQRRGRPTIRVSVPSSYEFKVQARDDLKKTGKRGSKRYRERLWRDGFRTCYYCRRGRVMELGHPHTLTVEHKMPLCLGGTYSRANIAAACSACNNAKGGMTEAEFRALGCNPVRVRSERRTFYDVKFRCERFKAKLRRIGKLCIARNIPEAVSKARRKDTQ